MFPPICNISRHDQNEMLLQCQKRRVGETNRQRSLPVLSAGTETLIFDGISQATNKWEVNPHSSKTLKMDILFHF